MGEAGESPRDGGLPVLLLVLFLFQQGGEVESRALQLTVGSPCYHLTLTMMEEINII